MKLTEHEIELIDGMIEVQKYHADQCDYIQGSKVMEKIRARDMEKIALLEKIKATGISK
jgi:hypothetical protein